MEDERINFFPPERAISRWKLNEGLLILAPHRNLPYVAILGSFQLLGYLPLHP